MKVIFPGALSTFQDQGRRGFQKYGITTSGAMDQRSMKRANALVGNELTTAVLEMTVAGPILRFSSPAVLAVAGAPMTPAVNQQPIPMNTAFLVQPGDMLSLGCVAKGCRAYLAVKGGFSLTPAMGSCSTDLKCSLGGFYGRALKAGDEVGFVLKEPGPLIPRILPGIPCPQDIALRVVPGPQEDSFTPAGQNAFYTSIYRVSDSSDRMGCRLLGDAVENTGSSDIISDGIVFGSVQIPPNGMPIVLMADHQTTGGYAKIGTVITCDLPKLAQAKPGDTVRFSSVTVQEAQALLKEEAEAFQRLLVKMDTAADQED